MRKLLAEFFGTFWLVFGGCGAAVFAAGVPDIGIGLVGVSLAFGLTVLTMAYAVGHISGGHFNPAVTLGLWASGRFSSKEIVPYIVSQVIGATVAAGALYFSHQPCVQMVRSWLPLDRVVAERTFLAWRCATIPSSSLSQ